MYKFRSVGRPTNLNLAGVYFIPEYFSNNQTRGGRAGQPIGAPNYRNDILIGIVKLYLPQGLEAWREVTVAYQRESMEATLRWGGDLRDNWNRKLCNRMQKPKGKPGVLSDCVFRCIEIERRIQDEANAAILVTMVTAGYCI